MVNWLRNLSAKDGSCYAVVEKRNIFDNDMGLNMEVHSRAMKY